MQHTTEELILAAHVRRLAADLRTATGMRLKEEAGNDAPLNEWMDLYRANHPLEEFVPQALQRLIQVADIVKRELTSPPSK